MKALVLLLFLSSLFTTSAQTTGSITFGHTDTVPSTIFTETQQINIYLPADYNPDSAATYPVIYLLDAERDTPVAYVCRGRACSLPLSEPAALAQELAR